MKLSNLKFKILAWYYTIKDVDKNDVNDLAFTLARRESKETNRPIEIGIDKRRATFFPCGCNVDLWTRPYTRVFVWKCHKHSDAQINRKGWVVIRNTY